MWWAHRAEDVVMRRRCVVVVVTRAASLARGNLVDEVGNEAAVVALEQSAPGVGAGGSVSDCGMTLQLPIERHLKTSWRHNTPASMSLFFRIYMGTPIHIYK